MFNAAVDIPDTFATLNTTGIWLHESDSLRLIALDGKAAPDTSHETVFKELITSRVINNNAGQIAFQAALTGPGVQATNSSGIWATDPAGQLRLVVRTGDLFDVDDDPLVDDLRTISVINLTTGADFESKPAPSLNEAGQIVLNLKFTDGSEGIFVATIPEPASVLLMTSGLGLIYKRHR